MLIIGSHVSFGNQQLKGSVLEAISYQENTFMFYTGAPTNTIRKPIDLDLVKEADKLMFQHNINKDNVICHAPYIINLANNSNIEKYLFSISFLKSEVERCSILGIKYLVIHPGNAVGISHEEGIKNVIEALNKVLNDNVMILIETMAGKGSEVGSNLKEVKQIIDGVDNSNQIGVCLDTCHLNDAGYNMKDFLNFKELLKKLIGLDKIKCIHVNDSKNDFSSHKDRHTNIGFGTIGFDSLIKIIYDPDFENIPKILETPYIGNTDDDKNRLYPPYKYEIEMIKNKTFNENILNDIRSFYQNN